MPFSQHNYMIQALTPDGSNQPLHVGPLPWARRSGEDFFHAHAWDSLAELTPIDLVPISQQVTWCVIFGKGFDHLLSGPARRGMLRHLRVNHTSPVMTRTTKTNKTRKVAVGTVKKSIDTRSWIWLFRKALQVWEGGFRC